MLFYWNYDKNTGGVSNCLEQSSWWRNKFKCNLIAKGEKWIICTLTNVHLHVNDIHIGLVVSQRQVKHADLYEKTQTSLFDDESIGIQGHAQHRREKIYGKRE